MDWTQDAALPPMAWRPWTAQSRAIVTFLPGEHKAAERTAQRLFGRVLRPQDYAGLAGAPDGATVEVGACDGRLYIELGDPAAAYRGYYYIYCRNAAIVLLNDGFCIAPGSRSRRTLAEYIRTRALGTGTIEAFAAVTHCK